MCYQLDRQENQMYQIKPDGTITVVPSAKEDPTWKTMTRAEKIAEGFKGKDLDLIWQKNSSGQIQRKSEITKETKKQVDENLICSYSGLPSVASYQNKKDKEYVCNIRR